MKNEILAAVGKFNSENAKWASVLRIGRHELCKLIDECLVLGYTNRIGEYRFCGILIIPENREGFELE